MQDKIPEFVKPRFRSGVGVAIGDAEVTLTLGERQCLFECGTEEREAVAQLMSDLKLGDHSVADLTHRTPSIADHIPPLLVDLERLRFVTESQPIAANGVQSGAQLYREIRRLADRIIGRVAKSTLCRAFTDGKAKQQHLLGYGLEYYCIVRMAPGLIAPALASAHSPADRTLLQEFLSSELGHDSFLRDALHSVGMAAEDLEAHEPLAATFSLAASLGVYARQHPLSFKSCLFLFERSQPAFIDAFEMRCIALGFPESFYRPFREHAEINADYDHEDISRALLELEPVIDRETSTIVKQHVVAIVETMILQEEQILEYYGEPNARIPRVFA